MKKELLLLFLLGIFLIPLISSATFVNIVTPANESSISGSTYSLSVWINESANVVYIGNVTWYYQPWSYQNNGSWILIGTTENTTANQSVFTRAWSTLTLDFANYTINATAKNYDASVNSTNITGNVTIENGAPSASWSTASLTSVTDGYNAYSGTSFTVGTSAESTTGAVSCLIYATDLQNSTVISTTSTMSSDACSNATITPQSYPLVKGRAYNLLTQVTDGNGNKTNSSNRRVNYLSGTAGAGGSSGADTGAGTIQNIISGGGSGGFWTSMGNFFKSVFKVITFWTDKY